jgi:DedD protein
VNSRYDRDSDLQDLHDSDEPDREISLGTTTILGIFLVLALLCAAFFGIGYSLGRHSVQPAAVAADAPEGLDTTSGSKPAPGSPLSQGRNGSSSAQPTDAASPAESSQDAADNSQQEPAPAPIKTVVSTPAPVTSAASSTKAAVVRPVAAAMVPVSAAAAGPGSPVVQVAAVSHQEDADILAAALKRRGYSVTIRQVPQDKLLHVQVGPFATKKDADAMRQRLQADGYNAIVK